MALQTRMPQDVAGRAGEINRRRGTAIGYHQRMTGKTLRRFDVMTAGLVVLAVAGIVRAGSLSLVDDLPGSFIDISLTGGTPLNLADDEEVSIGTFPGSLVFPAGNVVVANNGGIGFGNVTVTDLAALNEPIPSGNAFVGGQATLAFWDDIDDKEGDVFFAEFNDRLIVQWNNRPLAADPLQTVRFQIQVFLSAGPGDVFAQFLFDDVAGAGGAAGATIGYQDGDAGFGDVQWSFNTAGAVTDGTVLSLVMSEPNTHAVPFMSDTGTVTMILVLLATGVAVVGRGRRVAVFRRGGSRTAAP